jgi:hypothetical protein
MGEGRNMFRVSMGKHRGERPLGGPRCRLENGIKIDIREIGSGGMEWINLAQDRDRWLAVVSALMDLLILAPKS